MPESPCPFCNPESIATDVTVETARSGRECWVFEPLNPVAPGHVLVVPRNHVAHAAEDPHSTADVMWVAANIAGAHESANIITSIGEPATQSVNHLHAHVVPRVTGDGLPLPWTPQQEKEPAQ